MVLPLEEARQLEEARLAAPEEADATARDTTTAAAAATAAAAPAAAPTAAAAAAAAATATATATATAAANPTAAATAAATASTAAPTTHQHEQAWPAPPATAAAAAAFAPPPAAAAAAAAVTTLVLCAPETPYSSPSRDAGADGSLGELDTPQGGGTLGTSLSGTVDQAARGGGGRGLRSPTFQLNLRRFCH